MNYSVFTIPAAIQFSSQTGAIKIVRLGMKADVASFDVGL